jgi:predicted nucleotidyltransferase
MTSNEILQYLQSKQAYFRDNFGIEFVGIFGSFSRGEATEKSDIDILYKIKKDTKLSMFSYLKINTLLEEFFHRKVDLVRDETLKPTVKEYIEKDLMYV